MRLKNRQKIDYFKKGHHRKSKINVDISIFNSNILIYLSFKSTIFLNFPHFESFSTFYPHFFIFIQYLIIIIIYKFQKDKDNKAMKIHNRQSTLKCIA